MTTRKSTDSTAQAAAVEAVETIASVGKETLETVVKIGADAATEGYRNAAAYGRDQADMAHSAYDKTMGYSRDNVDAMSEASALAIAGAEACLAEVADYTKTALAENLELMQRAIAVKSPLELFDIQIEACSRAGNRMITQTTKMNQIATESVTRACAPIKARMDKAMETFFKPYTA